MDAIAKVGETLIEGAIAKIRQAGTALHQRIRQRLQGHAEAEKVLTAAEVGSEPDLQRLTNYLQGILEREPDFAKELQPFVREIEQTIQVDAPNARNILQVFEGQGLQVNDPQSQVIQAGNNNTFNFNTYNSPG